MGRIKLCNIHCLKVHFAAEM